MLDVGTKAPDFTLVGTQGEFTLSGANSPVVLMFYPGDNTPG